MDIESLILPGLIAMAVGLAIWGAFSLAGGQNREKKRLSQRLGNESSTEQQITDQFKPLLRVTAVSGVPQFLANKSFIQSLNRKLLQASPGSSLGKLFSLAFILAFVTFFVAFAVGGSLAVSAVGAAIAGYLPFFHLNGKCNKRQRQMADQLPEALDFLSRVLRAGHSFSTGLQMMADELPQPLAGEFRRCYDQHSLGQPLDESLKDTAGRVDNTDFSFFVTALLIQRQTGGDLSEVLGNISHMIRGRIRLQNQVRAKTAEGRFTGYILVAFPAVMFGLVYTQNPEYCHKLLTGDGRYLLGIALGLQMAGLFTIKKITTIKV
ncbi:type II secretion system F family protein [Humisphaera borealis]|uniref:Type II secretion system F family protein n=1 Tax=Humisphaera borealis TaxID=2807512 RepID=A0A7M2WWR2_9BACT|nr:type II secretion system F family protein [Humisphaera borealis]QOV89271.1 type II secretion system F family protein [Humisphaera borealis]